MVIRIGAGDVGSGISQLVKDMRSVMEPETASRLSVCAAYAFAGYPPRFRTCSDVFDRKGSPTGYVTT